MSGRGSATTSGMEVVQLVSGNPPSAEPAIRDSLQALSSGPPQLAVGQWGQAACRAPGLALADCAAPLLRSTCTATAHKGRSTSHAQQALAHVAQC